MQVNETFKYNKKIIIKKEVISLVKTRKRGKGSGSDSSFELKLLEINIERSRIARERAILVFLESLFIYFSFMFIAVFGFVNKFLNGETLNWLVLAGLLALCIGVLPSVYMMFKEGRKFDELYEQYQLRLKKEGEE